ncbi:ATP-binding protein [Bacillus sp. USDA818B3_A]|uniref:ATP-binding protein n=1 Tax=Bacillus sp. USDA818B3_A TaxID=2698834 RepID=UPI0013695C2A|nr:ATP-binding protein [Bacillus sp. USDA818B3_A]
MKVTLESLEDIIRNGENDNIEFKIGQPRPSIIAKLIAAFANTKGGTIVFGISEVEGVVGCDTTYVRKAILKAMEILSVSPNLEIYEINYKGKSLLAVEVEKVKDEPISANGAYYIRQGEMVKTMTASGILQAYKLDADEIKKDKESDRLHKSIDRLANDIANQSEKIETQTKTIETQSEKIEAQTKTIETQSEKIETQTKTIETQSKKIEELEENLKEANSIKSKLKDYVIGGLIGAILSTILAVLFL